MPSGESRPFAIGCQAACSPERPVIVGAWLCPPEEQPAATSASTQRAPPSRRTPLRLNRGRLEHDPLTLVWKRSCWIVGVDLAREPVAVEGRFGDDPRSDAVADPV